MYLYIIKVIDKFNCTFYTKIISSDEDITINNLANNLRKKSVFVFMDNEFKYPFGYIKVDTIKIVEVIEKQISE